MNRGLRPSPAQSATLFSAGHMMTGQDGMKLRNRHIGQLGPFVGCTVSAVRCVFGRNSKSYNVHASKGKANIATFFVHVHVQEIAKQQIAFSRQHIL